MPVDISSQTTISQADAKEHAEAVVSTMPIAPLVLETNLRVRSASQLFYETFQVVPEETEGRLIYELGNGQWNIPKLRTLLEEILPDNEVFLDYEVEHTFEGIGRRIMLLNGRRLDHVQLILLVIVDISERKQSEEALESLVQTRTEQVRRLVTQLTMSEQEERRRISTILHDDLQQRLYSVNFQLATLRSLVTSREGEEAHLLIGEIEESLNDSVKLTRNLSVDLSPPVLHNEGLFAALRWLAAQMEEQQRLVVSVVAEDGLPPLDEDLRVLLFQFVRELLFNVVKHAVVLTAVVALTYEDDHFCIEVSDQGQGFDANIQGHQNNQGLLRVTQRLHLLDGRMNIDSRLGEGTRITLYVPLRGKNGDES
jgi:signal transduction histidine kinase